MSSAPSLDGSSKMTEAPKLTGEFRGAFELLENTSQNVFLTGKAGTGKSTFLTYFRKHTKKNIAVVAPTGVAALNVSGQTIHSFFRMKPKFVDVKEIKSVRSEVIKKLDLLIIDEISMVRADVFDGIDHTLRRTRKCSEPFGGVQVCVIGDLFQLPPVVGRAEMEFYRERYESPFFFCTDAYREGNFHNLQFSTIHRQNDEEFIEILNQIRSGECDEETLKTLNGRVIARATPAPGTLVLCTTNALAESINQTKLNHLSGELKCYDGSMSGTFNVNGDRLPAPQELRLKEGAQVMLTKNDPEGRWVNGSLGTVEAMKKDAIMVRVDGECYRVEAEKWKTLGYEYDEDEEKIVEKTLGSYTQFPLTLAWAITIHKSQGKTLKRAIIDLGSGAFAPGQLYVALSRCVSLDGIALKKPINAADIRCDGQVMEFTESAGNGI